MNQQYNYGNWYTGLEEKNFHTICSLFSKFKVIENATLEKFKFSQNPKKDASSYHNKSK